MKKITIILMALLVVSFLFTACQKTKEPEGKKEEQEQGTQLQQQPTAAVQEGQIQGSQTANSRQSSSGTSSQATDTKTEGNGTVPLITEVMTKDELQAYLKEKGIPIITKKNFKEPELVWEKTFENEYISHIKSISDLTEKGNSIITSGNDSLYLSERSLLFLDNKGNIRQKINLGKIERTALAVAQGGNAAIAGKWKKEKKKLTLFYYDEGGKEVWKKVIELKALGKILISDNGETIAVEEGNPKWSIEEWDIGDLNVSRIIFFDSKGNQLYEHKKFRNIGWGEFSGDGTYYAGLFWRQDEMGKLIYINIKEGKILWEKPFGGNSWKTGELFGEDKDMAVSEKGSYISVINKEPSEKTQQGRDSFDYYELNVFNRNGTLICKTKGTWVNWINEKGFVEFEEKRGEVHKLAHIFERKIIKSMHEFFTYLNSNNLMVLTYLIEKKEIVGYQLSVLTDESLSKKKLEDIVLGRFTFDGKYLKGSGGPNDRTKVIFLRLKGGE